MVRSPCGFPKDRRLLTSKQFRDVVTQKARTRDQNFRVHTRPNSLQHARLGLTVSRRVDRRAVGRNRLKRVIREWFRANRERLPGMDLVVIAATPAAGLPNPQLRMVLEKLWQKIECAG
ncbi:MAG: ribonuclease P protein component [Gammaproteobacteria bacterium]|nr:ribonuclease P protein component [Gammaproteobacteria bacterium]